MRKICFAGIMLVFSVFLTGCDEAFWDAFAEGYEYGSSLYYVPEDVEPQSENVEAAVNANGGVNDIQ